MSHSSSPNGTDKVFATRKPVFEGGGGEQEKCRPVCASALSDQPLCCSLFIKYHS